MANRNSICQNILPLKNIDGINLTDAVFGLTIDVRLLTNH